MDVDSIALGMDFIEAINDAVASCDALIAVIGSEWVNITDKKGKIRLQDGNDFVRIELAAALERNIRVVPVLVDGADIPQPEELPETLRPLSRRHGITLSHEHFRVETARLINDLERVAAVQPRAATAQPAPSLREPDSGERTPVAVSANWRHPKILELVLHLTSDHHITIDNSK